jgi:hypothetical protein
VLVGTAVLLVLPRRVELRQHFAFTEHALLETPELLHSKHNNAPD